MEPTHDLKTAGNGGRQPAAPHRDSTRNARTVALHVARLVWAAATYLGATALDFVYAARVGLLRRSRARFPDRAGEVDARMARLQQQRSERWSSWKTLPSGRRMEIRFAAVVIAAAALLGLRAYFTRGASPAVWVAHQPRHAPARPPRSGGPSM